MKVGIMGGTFDPIHNGHMLLAKKAYEQYQLDKVLIMPSANPPHKKESVTASAKERGDMSRLAASNLPFLEYSGIELERSGYIYSADTLTILKNENPKTDYYFIIGADSLFSLEHWYHPETLLGLTHVLAANRGEKDNEEVQVQIDYLNKKYHACISLLNIPKIDISSSKIRHMIQEKKEVSGMLPQNVYDYIREAGVYD